MANNTRSSKKDKQTSIEVNSEADDHDLDNLMKSLSDESQTLVKIITVIITSKFKSEMDGLKSELATKDKKISELQQEITGLKVKIEDLENTVDSVDQYERRDTIIFSGPLLPEESPQENATTLITSIVKDHLKINIREEDINVAHRLGPKSSQRKRPLIVKLHNRTLKYDLMGACIQLKPKIFINESLTPSRLHLYKQILNIRKEHRDKFQQCYTKDGKINIKLKNSTVKYIIVDQRTLIQFLDKYPLMKDTYLQATTALTTSHPYNT